MILFKRHMFLVIKTQASVRRRKYQNRYFNIRRGFINFQSIIRQHQGRQRYHRIWALIVRIQSLMRQFLAKMTLFKKKKGNKIVKVPQRQYKRCVAEQGEKNHGWRALIYQEAGRRVIPRRSNPSC